MNKQQEALRLALEALGHLWLFSDEAAVIANPAITALREALAEQPAQTDWEAVAADQAQTIALLKAEQPAQQEPVAFLANGTRFKISYDSRQSGGQIHGIPPELGGRWVAFVAADDDCHLKFTSPPASKPLTDEQIDKLPWGPHEGNPMTFAEGLRDFARAIEAAHGIKGDA